MYFLIIYYSVADTPLNIWLELVPESVGNVQYVFCVVYSFTRTITIIIKTTFAWPVCSRV